MSENLKRLEEAAAQKVKKLNEEFQGKINLLKERIAGLEHQKLQIKNGKISKGEAIQRMKEDLQKGFEAWIMERIIRPNLSSYQMQYRALKDFDHLKVHQLANTEWLSFIYSWIQPEMIDQASSTLEEGPDEKTRNEKIKRLDEEISKAEREMENLLK